MARTLAPRRLSAANTKREGGLRHAGEALAVWFAQTSGATLPRSWSSTIGGAVAERIGPRAGRSRIARENLARVMPEIDAAARDALIRRMWGNFGRAVFETAHLKRIPVGAPDCAIVGGDALKAAAGGPTLIFGAHFGNWSAPALAAVWAGHKDVSMVYRRANNPAIDRCIIRIYGWLGVKIIHKGASGARDIMAALKRGGTVFMLMDQKMNDGVSAPFFGHPAMTAPAIGQLAVRFDCPVFPIRGVRRKTDRGRWTNALDIHVEPPMRPERAGDRAADAQTFVERVNDRIEDWVRADPDQWLWVHRRWGRWSE